MEERICCPVCCAHFAAEAEGNAVKCPYCYTVMQKVQDDWAVKGEAKEGEPLKDGSGLKCIVCDADLGECKGEKTVKCPHCHTMMMNVSAEEK